MQNKYLWMMGIGIFLLLVLVQILLRAKHPVKRAAGGVMTGFLALAAVNISGLFTGVTLPLSLLTLGVSAVAGIPGVTMLLLLNLLVQ